MLIIIRFPPHFNHIIIEGEDFTSYTGKGASVKIKGVEHYIGNSRLFEEMGISLTSLQKQLENLQRQGNTVMLVGRGQEAMGLIAVADKIREGSHATVEGLRWAGISKVVDADRRQCQHCCRHRR